jgi:ABC-type nitrate/sulfonate/bicarbonate transport system permease component
MAAVIVRPIDTLWLRASSFAALLLLWQLSSLWLAADTLPAPFEVLQRLWSAIVDGELPRHLAITLGRVAISFCVAMVIGAALGVLMGRLRRFDAVTDGLLVLGLNTPALVVIVLSYLWWGLSETATILAVVINKVPTVAVTVREGARAVDAKLLAVAKVYRLSAWRTLLHIYLPQLQPYLIAAARSGLSLIWKIVLVVELLGRSSGVGFQLGTFFQYFDIAGILAYTLAFAAVVFAIEALLLRPLDRRVARWQS